MKSAKWASIFVAILLVAVSAAFGQSTYKLVEQLDLTKGALCGAEKPSKTESIQGQIVKRVFAADGRTLAGITLKDKHGQSHDIRIDGEHIAATFPPLVIHNIYDVFGQERYVKVFADVCGATPVARKVQKKKSS